MQKPVTPEDDQISHSLISLLKKKMPNFIAAGVVLAFLATTNPYSKEAYITNTTARIQDDLCNQDVRRGDREECEQICKAFSPLTTQILKGLLHVYTTSPQNYWLFSVFTTELPGSEFRAIGVAGQYIYISENSTMVSLCDFLESDVMSLLYGVWRLQRDLEGFCSAD